jgi:hypothetical protein
MQASIASGEQARASREAILARSKADTSKYASNASTSIAKGGSAAGGFLDMMGGAGGAGSNTAGLTGMAGSEGSTGGVAGTPPATTTAPATPAAQSAPNSTANGMNTAEQQQAQAGATTAAKTKSFGAMNLFS